jgi:glycosidase
MEISEQIIKLFVDLYGKTASERPLGRLKSMMESFRLPNELVSNATGGLSHRDAFLIAYPDQVQAAGLSPLRCLSDFCSAHLRNVITAVHLLPFFPFSSDDGFSVIDYRRVDPLLGSWEDIAELGANFRLMFDAVVNHISAQHEWFQGFLKDDPTYREYFTIVEGTPDLSRVVRPRTFPLLTEFRTQHGPKMVWTTFSEDQIDLNFRNPDVLLEVLDVLLFYVSRGSNFLRLDAIAYLWKEFGTPCIHLPQTHAVIKLIRAVLDQIAPHVLLITETNVPHAENISYFGDGVDEAQLVYNFALPPLLLHTFRAGTSRSLTRWAASLNLPSNKTTFFNFLASHDGIGINPVRNILTNTEIDAVVRQCLDHGGLVSYKRNSDGTESPYELNINYFDALSSPLSAEDSDLEVDRFLAAHSILLSLIGVPAFYFHSLFGSRSWSEGPSKTGRNRTINREKLIRLNIENELRTPGSLRFKVFSRLTKLLQIRSQHPAFDPYGAQEVLEWGDSLFALVRTSAATRERILCLQNITSAPQIVRLPESFFGINLMNPSRRLDTNTIEIRPYEGLWLQLQSA